MQKQISLLPGEQPMPQAPNVALDEGINCIPQHYLTYQHSIDSVSHIISLIDYAPDYVLFVDSDAADSKSNGIFIQVGIIGVDNYRTPTQGQHKIVYGRKWRVEPTLPSSEIIQTAFLALQKAREHEIRELIKFNDNSVKTTPFSCHHDLPLMAMSSATKVDANQAELSEDDIKSLFESISYDYAAFGFNSMQQLPDDRWLICLDVHAAEKTGLPELLDNRQLCFISPTLSRNHLLYSLVDSFLDLSNKHVEENFKFKGFARFSRKNSVLGISRLSAETRHMSHLDSSAGFKEKFSNNNYETDLTRVPRMPTGILGDKILTQFAKYNIAEGILPRK